MQLVVQHKHIEQANEDRDSAANGQRYCCPVEYALMDQLGLDKHHVQAGYATIFIGHKGYKTPSSMCLFMQAWDGHSMYATPGVYDIDDQPVVDVEADSI